MDVSRRVLFESDRSQFQVRYFEVAPNGYTSFEEHDHEHCVLVLQGTGEVYLDGDWSVIKEGDLVIVKSGVTHQFRNSSTGVFGIVCIVDKDRDRPRLLGNSTQD